MKVAAIQFNARADKAENLARAVKFIREAIKRGAKFIALPEIFIYRGQLNAQVLNQIAENANGPTIKTLSQMARQNKVYILAGSIYEASHLKRRVYNTSVLIGDTGKILARYRKINLFNAVLGSKKIKESDNFLPGTSLAMAMVGGFKTGMSVCYDLRFPRLYQSYAQKGAHVLLVPSAFTKRTGQAHWKVLLRARAIENQCYVVAPNQVGADGRGIASFGHSMIISPWGEVLAEGSADKEEIVSAEISHQAILQVKKILPISKK